MSLNLVSPGIKVREVDLTVGRLDAVNDQIGAFVGPFSKGPVDVPVLVETEKDLLNTFGRPLDNDGQYEYWMTASSYLSYGGVMRVVRTDNLNIKNANFPVSTPVSLKIKNQEDYASNYSSATDWIYAAKDPGSWGNGLTVCVIDNAADQELGIGTFGIQVGYAITCGFSTDFADSKGNVDQFSGFVKGVVTGVGKDKIDVKNQDPQNPLYKKYFMHGTSHFLGLDVHDIGNRYEPIKEGMVFTCEPGIYIREEGLGVRIENDILISTNENVDLMSNIPIEVEAIENLMNN